MNRINTEIQLQLKLIKRPTAKDTIIIDNYQYPMKPVKQFLTTLKNHCYNLSFDGHYLVIDYQNKQSTGKARFIGRLVC